MADQQLGHVKQFAVTAREAKNGTAFGVAPNNTWKKGFPGVSQEFRTKSLSKNPAEAGLDRLSNPNTPPKPAAPAETEGEIARLKGPSLVVTQK